MAATGSAQIDLPRYRSHKTVWALKIKEVDAGGPNPGRVILVFEDTRYAPSEVSIIDKPKPQAGWYYVAYENDYYSFSPAEVFEKGYTLLSLAQEEEAFSRLRGIGWAVKQLHHGAKVARAGWNGKGMFLILVPGSTFKVNRPPLLGVFPEGTEVQYHAHVDMKTADNKVVPWLASQTDLLATDWVVVE
jgi:Protein of unknown function (DUF2829)